MITRTGNKRAGEAVTFGRYARLDGSLENTIVVGSGGLPTFAPQINDVNVREKPFVEAGYVGLLRALYGNMTKLQRRTWHKLLAERSILEISREEGVSHAAIHQRVQSMVKRNGFVKRWWRRRNRKNQYG